MRAHPDWRDTKEPLSFAKGKCDHDWRKQWPDETLTPKDNRATYVCTKCKVRFTTFPREQ